MRARGWSDRGSDVPAPFIATSVSAFAVAAVGAARGLPRGAIVRVGAERRVRWWVDVGI